MTNIRGDIKTVRAVERAVDVLMCFTRETPTLSVTDLQKTLGLSRPTLYRLLQTLEGKGLIRSFGEPQRFQLAHGAIALGNAALARIDVARVAEPYLLKLWDGTDETVALFVPVSGNLKTCVQEIQSRQALVYTRGAGFTEPMTIGASGKAILAFAAPADMETALAKLEHADGEALRAELLRIGRDGYCISVGEIIDGAVAIAAPVFQRDGTVAGSVSIYGPETRLTGAHRDTCVSTVCLAAEQISRAMGHLTPAAIKLGAA